MKYKLLTTLATHSSDEILWGRHSPTSFDRDQRGKSRNLGHGSILALSKKPLPLRHFFHVLLFRRVPYLKKLDKTKGRHQAKDHAQLLMLRDSFLDLIPALCFHIHGWEDGSLCQSIQLVQVATLPYRGRL